MNALQHVRPAVMMVILFTLVTGVAYPLAVTGLAQLALPYQAGGSLVRDAGGQVRGSALIAQGFAGAGYLHPRLSAAGNNGYDATSSATAMGNAATAFACSDCGGAINITNSQTNSGGVSAVSTLSITGANRSVTGVATAVGNNATFYVSKPSH